MVALLNLLTYVFFRILLLGWLALWQGLHRDDIPLELFTVMSLGLAYIVWINILNFYRLLISDFIRPDKERPDKVECRLTSDALDQAIKDSDGSNGFHPVTKDVNRLVTSLFNPDDEGSNQGQPPLTDDQALAKKFK